MQLYCTRPNCAKPVNHFPSLSSAAALKTAQQKYCTTCGMPLILSGRYLPEKLLGQGGFGAAFYARDRFTPTQRPCVVKLFQPSSQLSPQQLQIAQGLFEREAAVLEQLGNQHPQIPDLYAFFPLVVPGQQPNTTTEFFYLVQEFINGEDLEQRVERDGALPEAEVRAIVVNTLKILDFVHQNGAIHRDIKPSNIMQSRDGRLYLLDFGAVKQVTGATGMGKSTGIYTMGYAPQELMSGGNVYPSSDLYSLAVTAAVLLTAKAPNELYDSYANRWQWRSHVQLQDRGFGAVLDKMLAATPRERFASAEAALQALMPSLPRPVAQPVPPPVAKGSPTPGSSTQLQPPRPMPVPAPQPPMRQRASLPMRSLPEFLGGAAFTGFEGSLLAVATASLLGTTLVGTGTWLLLVLALIFLQVRRVIEGIDLAIIAGVTLPVVLFVGPLRQAAVAVGLSTVEVIVVAAMVALGLVAIATLFRLIYRIVSGML
ncbi:MAG: serine/threonine-protein kinase [Cyanobacteria bacterium J06648_16]